jgi:putative tricarboxylic transport membrane protein
VKGRDVASGVFWLLVGAFVVWSGWDLELGSVNDPGSGFMFFWIGIVMVALSVAVLAPALRPAAVPHAAIWGTARWSRVGSVLAALIVYAWLLPRLGFLLTTALVMLFLFKVVEPQRWWVAVAGAVLSALIAYVVFKVWLGAQLPAGVFDIG